jgi:hypothetical protein
VRRQTGEQGRQVRLDVDPRLARVLDQREQVRQARPGVRVPDE